MGVIWGPRKHLAMSGDVLGCYNMGGGHKGGQRHWHLVGRGEGILLNILQMLESPFPPPKMLCPQVSVVSRLRSPAQRGNHIKEQNGRGELEKRCTRI